MSRVVCSVCGRSYPSPVKMDGDTHTQCSRCIIDYNFDDLGGDEEIIKDIAWEMIKGELLGTIKWEGPISAMKPEAQAMYDKFVVEARAELVGEREVSSLSEK